MRDRIRTVRTIGGPAAAAISGRTAGVRPQGAAVPLLFIIASFILFLAFILCSSPAWSATPPGTVISNVANLSYTPGAGLPVTTPSPTVSVTVVVVRTASVLELLQYGPGAPGAQLVTVGTTSYSTGGTAAGPFSALPPPTHVTPGVGPGVIDLSVPVPLVPVVQYHIGEPVFLRLTDGDQNTDPAVRETVIVTIQNSATGDREVLRLLETGPNTGVFTGYVQTGAGAAAVDGALQVASESTINAAYVDIADAGDTRAAGSLVDPFGMVFSSGTGLPVDGATVTMIDALTGSPAMVYGEDGVSIFPSSVVSGGTATDSSGRTYTFTAGGYRFPYITPGTYRLVVTPPPAYRAPSVVPTAVLQSLPGAPFAIADPGSRGEDFVVNPGPAVHIDIPVDPAGTGLWLVKTAGKQTAAAGDFVPYRLSVENTSMAVIAGVRIVDQLPLGIRYRKGSGRLNGAAAFEPVISADGRTLTFTVGTLNPAAAPGSTTSVTYVAEVGAGARLGAATNSAVATNDAGVVSNRAQATIMVIEDLFRSTTTIVGRVSVDGCGVRDASEQGGLAGVRIYLEDGTFVVTDRNGMYHFAQVRPGTHVVQLDLATLQEKYEVLPCEENTRFAGKPFSQFVDAQGGALWRADFHLGLRPKAVGEVSIELRTPVEKGPAEETEESIRARKDVIKYTVPITVSTVPARNLRITIMLPEGAQYRPGSSVFDGAPVPDPELGEGSVTFRIIELPANWEGKLQFDALVPAAGVLGPLCTQAMLTTDTPGGKGERTPVVDTEVVRVEREYLVNEPPIVLHPQFESGSAALTKKDRQELELLVKRLRSERIASISATGHTDDRPISPRLQRLYPDNHILSQARASSVGNYLAQELNLAAGQIAFAGRGPDEPVADNGTDDGRAKNRRVELRVVTRRTVVLADIQPKKETSGHKAVATIGLRPGDAWPDAVSAPTPTARSGMPVYDAAWMTAASPGTAWLWPPEGYRPPIAATKVALQHDAALTPRLVLNGKPVNSLYFDGTAKRPDGLVAVSRWSGVHLLEGDNRFEALFTDATGTVVGRIERTFHSSGAPVTAELIPDRSLLVADGRTIPVLAVRLLDKDGHPVSDGTIGEFTVDPPHLAQQRSSQLQQSPLTAPSTDRVRYQVGADGIALIELAPTTRSGEALVRIPLSKGEQQIRAWLRPDVRDWVLVGLAEGTVGYNVVTGNMESLGAAGGEDNYYHEGRVAFYAKGMIKGDWLLTAAYDSAKEPNGKRGMYDIIDPNSYYLLYGDATEQMSDASSAKHVYVRLERNQVYALFGDFATNLNMTELSRYNRNLTGIKSEMKGDVFEYSLFAADTDQAHVKDELRGDGTSGLYRLSRRNIVLNSETITIETRDRFKSEVIVSSQRLTRHLDYTIDYESGTIFFKAPVPNRDENFNPVYIVAEYETFDSSNTSYTYGGRAAVKAPGNRGQVGVTYVHEGPRGAEGELAGVDATVQIDPSTNVHAEVAQSSVDADGQSTRSSSYLAEVQHHSPRMDGKVYLREQESGFGLGQQNGSESGTRKYGGDLTYRLSQPWSMGGEVFRQENLATGAVRDMAELRGRYSMPGYEVFAGLRHVEDTLGTGEAHRSEQLFLGAKYQFTERLTGRVQHDQTLSSTDQSVDYPTRTTVGLDYRVTRDTTVFADQELTRGDAADTATTRVGFRSAPWTGAQLGSTMEQQTTENGNRLFATTGLKQSWQITKRWSADAGMDRSATFHETTGYTMNTSVPPASGGTEDFTAVYLGAAYRADNWSWTGRIENRHADTEDKVSTYMGANGDVRQGLALAAGFQSFRSVNISGLTKFNSDLRFGAAYRPLETRYIVLDRFDYIRDEQQGAALPYDNWRVVNNFVLNYKLEHRTQWSFQYGSKFVTETVEQNDYRGYTDLAGIEGRYDISKKWDVGVRVNRLHSWAIHQTSYGNGASVGLNAGRNLWVSVGYNFAGFTDRDFSKADFTAEGPFIKIRMKFDQASVRDAVKWITGQ